MKGFQTKNQEVAYEKEISQCTFSSSNGYKHGSWLWKFKQRIG